MRIASFAVVLVACLSASVPARAADNLIERMATCQDSWFEGKDDPAQMKKLADSFNGAFTQKGNEAAFVPTAKTLVVGLPVVQAFPESVGMGVGFSVVLDANFDKTRTAIEKATGKSLKKCETGDNMRSCELEIAEKRTLMLMGGDNGKSKTTLVGCYYFYEK